MIGLFFALRDAGLKVSVREFLTLLEGLEAGLTGPSIDEFYTWARLCLVKDETQFDKFDQAFAAYVHGAAASAQALATLPEDWLRREFERRLSPQERAALQALDWDTLMDTLRQRLAEQTERHAGGSRWIGTGGSSPFGAWGENPRGIRIGQDQGRKRSAVKVWDQRLFQDYDDSVELNTRQLKVALRRLRRFAREGAADQLDLPDTIRSTAANAGWLDLKMVAERRNRVKVLLLMDVGGTMDDHVHRVEELFSAAKSEFKHLQFYYFHNCVYDHVWKDNRRRHAEKTSTWDLMHTYNKDYKLIFVGDATMSPYEIVQPGGSVEYHNPEPGAAWLQRLVQAFPSHAWINPEPQALWEYRQSISLIQQIIGQRMYGLTLRGLEAAMRRLGS